MAAGGLVERAREFARRAHLGQRKKNGRPMIEHLTAVCELVATAAGEHDPELLAAALLHDAVEDGHTDERELRERCGPRVAALVAQLSDPPGLRGAARRAWQIEHARSLSRDAKLIKLADKIDNIEAYTRRPPARWDAERLRRYFDWGARVAAELRGASPALERRFESALASARAAVQSAQ